MADRRRRRSARDANVKAVQYCPRKREEGDDEDLWDSPAFPSSPQDVPSANNPLPPATVLTHFTQ